MPAGPADPDTPHRLTVERRRGPERILLTGLLLLLCSLVLFATRPDLVRRAARALRLDTPDPTTPGPQALPASAPPAADPPANAQPAPALPEPPPAPAADSAEALEEGRRLFQEAADWVSGGQPSSRSLSGVFLDLDARIQADREVLHDGPLRLWLQQPDRLRQESTGARGPQTRILDGGNLWIAGEDGRFQHVNRTPDGAQAVAQATDDLERVAELGAFLSLRGLDGPGVLFSYVGETLASGDYRRQDVPGQPSGTWAKIVRRAPGRPNITFWLAHTTDAQGVLRATYPGVVRVDGAPQNNIPTEDYILQDWTDRPGDPPRPFRFPRRIRAYRLIVAQPTLRLLDATVADVRLDPPLSDALFAPP